MTVDDVQLTWMEFLVLHLLPLVVHPHQGDTANVVFTLVPTWNSRLFFIPSQCCGLLIGESDTHTLSAVLAFQLHSVQGLEKKMLSSLYLIAFNLYMSLKEKQSQFSRQNCLLRHSLTGVVSSKQLISEERHLRRSSLKLFDTFKTFLYVAYMPNISKLAFPHVTLVFLNYSGQSLIQPTPFIWRRMRQIKQMYLMTPVKPKKTGSDVKVDQLEVGCLFIRYTRTPWTQ